MLKQLICDRYKTELGTIITVFDGSRLCALDFMEYEDRLHRLLKKSYSTYKLILKENPFGFRTAVDAYLKGDVTAFDKITVKFNGTLFQQQVWQALRHIPAGATQSYSELAQKIKRPKAVRAVGLANSQNPIALVIPCHRVIGKNGSLTGYAGGLKRKEWLLRHEGAL